MSWLKVDDGFPSHEKVMALSEGPCRADAIALWTFCGCWSSHALRDGFVPTGVVRAYSFHPEAASELVRVKLWIGADGGYRFHDWADYQPSAAQIEERRKLGSERKARSRARLSSAKSESDVGVSRSDCSEVTRVPRAESRGCLADASRERERDSGSEILPEEEKKVSETTRAAISFRRPLPEVPPNTPPAEQPLGEWIAAEHTRRFLARTGASPGGASRYKTSRAIADWVQGNSEAYKSQDRALAIKLLDGLFASERAQAQRWPLGWILQDPTEFAGTPIKVQAAPAKQERSNNPTHQIWRDPTKEWEQQLRDEAREHRERIDFDEEYRRGHEAIVAAVTPIAVAAPKPPVRPVRRALTPEELVDRKRLLEEQVRAIKAASAAE